SVYEEMIQPKSKEDIVKQLGELLSTAINSGEKENAEKFAGQLALTGARVTITVDTSSLKKDVKDQDFIIKVFVEDREASGGCIDLKVKATDTVLDLKNKMFMKHNFPVEVQKWIIGKRMPPDTETLQKAKVTAGQSLFLYLVSAKSVGLTREEFNARKEQMIYNQDYMRMNPRTPVTPQSGQFSSQPPRSNPSPGIRPTQPTPPHQGASVRKQESREGKAPQVKPPTHQGESRQTVRKPESQQPKDQSFEFLDYPPELRQDPLANPMAAPIAASTEPKQVGWTCPDCTYINKPTWPGCEICSKTRPLTYKIPDNYKMTKEEEERLKREQESEQRAQKAAAERRPREMTNDEVITNLDERQLDQLLKFNDALQGSFVQGRGLTARNAVESANTQNLPFGPQPTIPTENQQLPAPALGYNIPPDGADTGGDTGMDHLQFHMAPRDINFDETD
ncbi:hypothetical protein FSP39_013084, partial [Pinctada imbricata]